MSGKSGFTRGTPSGDVNHEQSIYDKNNYIVRPPTFSGNSTEFEWWKSKRHTRIIGLDDELWNILKDGIGIQVNNVGMVSDRKSLTPAQKKIYRKHHRVRGATPHLNYLII